MSQGSFHTTTDDSPQLNRLILCPVCQSKRINYAFHISGRRHDECLECGLLFLNPQPDSKKLDQIYESAYLLGSQAGCEINPELIAMKRASAGLLFKLLRQYLDADNLQNQKLLDVGCGAGFLIAEAESLGMNCIGVDPSANLLDKADKIIQNSKIYRGSVLECNLEPGEFDICTLSDTIEYIPDIRGSLLKIRKLLKPGGILLIATPSLNSFSSKIMKNRWMEFKPEHLFYFNENSLQRLLYETGFSSITMYPHKKALNLEYIRSHFEKFPIAGFLGKLVQVGTELTPECFKRQS